MMRITALTDQNSEEEDVQEEQNVQVSKEAQVSDEKS
jgi:hypothetical protein